MTKLNLALLDWKSGDIHGLGWFMSKGLNRGEVQRQVKKGIYKKLGAGIYYKAHDEVKWQAVVRYLQEEEKMDVHVSSKSALALQGNSHYLSLGEIVTIDLMSFKRKSFPSWLRKKIFNTQFVVKKNSLLKEGSNYLNEIESDGFNIKIASRELAILELIDELDLSMTLETAENYLNSLGSLRPSIVTELIQKCNSVKAKRVFLYLTEKLQLPFCKSILQNEFDIGKGKRVIVKGGELNKKYLITVDRNYLDNPF